MVSMAANERHGHCFYAPSLTARLASGCALLGDYPVATFCRSYYRFPSKL
jgi:hypothetical protein